MELISSQNAALFLSEQSYAAFPDEFWPTRLDEKRWAYVDPDGNILVSQVLEKNISRADLFNDDYGIVELEGVYGQYVLDINGKIILGPEDQEFYYRNLGQGLFARSLPDDPTAKIVSSDGSIPYGDSIQDIQFASDDIGYYSLDNQLYGIWNCLLGKVVTQPCYSFITQFVDGRAVVIAENGNVELINEQGKCIVNLTDKYPDIDIQSLRALSCGVFTMQFLTESGIFIVDYNGDVVAKTPYDEINFFFEDIAVCKQNGLYGYVDAKGTEIIAPHYDSATNLMDGVGILTKGASTFRFTSNLP